MKMKNFTQIPNEILDESHLSIQARYLLCVLLRYCGQDDYCYPSQRTLARVLGCTDRHIRNLLKELLKSKLIISKRKGFNKPNTYTVSKTFERKCISSLKSKDRKSSSYHLGSRIPLNQGNNLPDNNTYRTRKDNTLNDDEMNKLREKIFGKKVREK